MTNSFLPTSPRAYGVALREQHILLVRASSRSNAPGVWWLPGGGIDFGESPVEAVIREVHEETGLTAHSPVLLDVASDVRTRANGETVHSIRIIYRVHILGDEPRHEQDGSTDFAQWTPLATLDDLDLADYARHAISLARQTK